MLQDQFPWPEFRIVASIFKDAALKFSWFSSVEVIAASSKTNFHLNSEHKAYMLQGHRYRCICSRPGKDSPTVKHGFDKTGAKLSGKEANAATSRRSTRRITIQSLTCEHPRMCCRMARTTLPHSVQRCFPPSVWTEFSEIRADKPRTGERISTKFNSIF